MTSDDGYIAAGVKKGNGCLVKLAGDGEGVEYEDTSDSSFSQIRNYIYDIFHGFFQWNHYK
ncbi:hypothetical protein EO95_06580 [Methanosarcina sp. 1.H.T.1A.1]|uniref:hypothetical protein n=1 Tax=Methanosarcina sp. 1.H.T.1A.1 TaxID=1483602 RepID=UPI0006225796|nr:hypothetical protein [Methanosarcina sp. 1.H.T.1A.1]KKH97017.1 hypothetical protein EO95_06580 [Methanosarcina sp. 1.H.T.1A.1]